ncbi:MAG: hypothetical protein FWC71_11390 [Defluviitaleaceae bacterium]|nr:hypothetical protein [Defluviitaleaceae bacterium]
MHCGLPASLGLAGGAGLTGTTDVTHNQRRGLMSAVARWSGHTSEEVHLLSGPFDAECLSLIAAAVYPLIFTIPNLTWTNICAVTAVNDRFIR